ncbi:hypothetical protein NC652_006667 [Populus alba x Populus x berolinensis]|nr:hypothetical protein NC652_006667 [Populus alba x Populus x berolinensis]
MEIKSQGDGRLSGAEGNGGAAGPLHVKAFPYPVHYSSSLLLKSQSPRPFDLVSLFQKVPPPRQILLVPTPESHASGLHLFPTVEPIQLELMVVVILHSPLHY